MKGKLLLIISLLSLSVILLALSSSQESAQPHYQLNEFKEKLENKPNALADTFMTVYGNVKEGSIYKKGITARFTIMDQNNNELNVFFTGKTLLPDTFKDGAQAAIDGRYDPASQIFMAEKVMAKCASKYEPAQSGMKMKKVSY
jgi:cytochrome c-type biogenesis protein CcmE